MNHGCFSSWSNLQVAQWHQTFVLAGFVNLDQNSSQVQKSFKKKEEKAL